MESDDETIATVTEMPAFRREFKNASRHTPARYLTDDVEYDVMRLCVSAAGDVTVGAQWYADRPLVEVYKWLAVRLANIEE